MSRTGLQSVASTRDDFATRARVITSAEVAGCHGRVTGVLVTREAAQHSSMHTQHPPAPAKNRPVQNVSPQGRDPILIFSS